MPGPSKCPVMQGTMVCFFVGIAVVGFLGTASVARYMETKGP